MMALSSGIIFRVTDTCERNLPVTGGFPSQRPETRSSDVFLYTPEQTFKQTVETLVIWDAIALNTTSL